MPSRLLIVVLAAAASAAAAGEVYKWTDAAGVVHYSDTKPPDQTAAQLVKLTETTTTESEAAPPPAKPEAEGEGIPVNGVQSAELRCDQARQNLELLQSKYTVGLDSRDGGPAKVLDDRARQQQIASAQTLISTYCK